MASNRPLHEVVADMDLIRGSEPNEIARSISPQLAAVLKAADAVRRWKAPCSGPCDCPDCDDVHEYDAAVADLRRVLEGK